MGILMGISGVVPTAGQAGFSPLPTFPEGEVGKGNGAPGIPSGEGFPICLMGNGKWEMGMELLRNIARGYPLSSAWWVLRYELAEQRHAPARISGGAAC